MAIETYKTKSGIRYKATLWHKNKPQGSATFQRKVDALDWLRREKTKLQDKKVGKLRGDTITLRQFHKDVFSLHHGVRPATWPDYLRVYSKHFDKKFGDRALTDITEEDWAILLKELIQDGVGPARCNRIHAVASAIYSVALKWRYVQYNPLTLVPYEEEALKDFKYWTLEDTHTFFYWARDNSERYALYLLLYETGLRISEALGLKWDAVDFHSNTISVRRAYSREAKRVEDTTKSGNKRTLWLSTTLVHALRALRQQNPCDNVFIKANGKPLRYERIREGFKKDQVAAGITNIIGVHDIRHTFASHFVMNGGSIYDLKALLGHSDVTTTMRYAHLAKDHLREKAALVQLKLPNKDNVIKLA